MYGELERIFGERCMRDVPMKKYTSFRTGGQAQILVLVSDEEKFVSGIKYVRKNNIEHHVFGNCTNVLISDSGLEGVVFMTSPDLSVYRVSGDAVIAGAGMSLPALSRAAHENSLSGMEFASGIPGTLGGAVAMNAGAYGVQMSDIVTETRYIDEDCKIRTAATAEHDFSYRHSIFCDSKKYIISSTLRLKIGDKEKISELMRDLKARRREKQPVTLPSAGSVFKRPAGCYAGKLIQEAGLMGCRVGGAEVSTLHAGFIVNTGDATSNDIYLLIKHIKKEVLRICGIELETEIKLCGDFGDRGAV
jgi:UDP-N-acetylmuramate dehydrogenase